MNAMLEWLNLASVAWWNYIVHTSWQAAVVGAVLLLVVNLVGRRWPAPLRYALLVLALLKFACPPLLPVPTGLLTQLISPRLIVPMVPERKPTQASASALSTPIPGTPAAERSGLAQPFPGQWTVGLMVAHLGGTAVLAVWIGCQAVRLRRLRRNARAYLAGPLYRDLVLQLDLKRIPPLVVSPEVEAPMAFGLRRPAILLPTDLVQRLSPAELKAVLAHELAHCQRGDLWLNWVQLALLAVWWFHPVLWLVHRALRAVREDCCDDLLLARQVISNDAYCDVLLRAASTLCPAVPLSASLGLGESIHPLGRRLARITDWTLKRSEGVSVAGATAVLLCAAMLLPGVRSRELLAETEPAHAASAGRMQSGAVAVSDTAGLGAVQLDQGSRQDLTFAPDLVPGPVLGSQLGPQARYGFGVGPVTLSTSRANSRIVESSPVQPFAGNAVLAGPTATAQSWAAPPAPSGRAEAVVTSGWRTGAGGAAASAAIHGWGYFRPPSVGVLSGTAIQPPQRVVTRLWVLPNRVPAPLLRRGRVSVARPEAPAVASRFCAQQLPAAKY